MEPDRRVRTSRRTLVEMVVVGAIASVLGIVAGLAIDWFPTAASSQSGPIDTLWDVLVICSVPIFVGVVLVILYAVRLFRQRPGEEQLDGPPIHGNTKLEVIWTALPAVLLVSLCTYAYVVLRDVEDAPAASTARPELRVEVFGEQFAWTFRYRTAENQEVNTTRLWLPQDRSVLFVMRSKDVIHDFWVPAFRMKEDVVPGITTEYRVTPTRAGEFPVVCAELCGLGHAYMRQTAKVVSEREFAAWLAERAAPADGAGAAAEAVGGEGRSTAALDGETIFTKGSQNGATACGACHQLDDAGTPAGVGPNMDVLAGQSPDEIRRDIVDPGAEVDPKYPDNVMPRNYGDVLKPEELDAVVQYLVEATK
jgi:cytochrome c oxidase subunit 2